jgi:hypothetical protein
VTDRRRRDWRPAPALVREAFTLPLVFLTAALGGGVRVASDGALTFVPPPLMSLVLAIMLLAALYRSSVLEPDALIRPDRGALANLNGALVLTTLVLASAQTLNALTPEAGLLAFTWNVVLLVFLANTLVVQPDRPRLLGSLLVIVGAAFVLKYVVLGAIYAPEGGLTRRVVMALLEGVSLGALAYSPPGPATGYIAFGVALLFLIGLVLLPGKRSRDSFSERVAIAEKESPHLFPDDEPIPQLRAQDPADR